ncbi:MAG: PEP-CTERM sorting domain-containing protein [Sedimentisphaerales bacterium]|nr:PEP-CTERM sorting domain-containing protein [Sedimentisphaerales bacterium]
MKMKLLVLLVSMALTVSASADIVYQNDFGTTAQREEWTLSNEDMVVFYDAPSLDHDGDGLGGEGRFVDGYDDTCYLSVQLDAPAGYEFTNLVATGQGYGDNKNWASNTVLALALPGEAWSSGATSTYPANENGWYWMTADATAVPELQNVSSVTVWMRLRAPYTGYLPRFTNIQVTADLVEVPEPASMTLLAIGGLVGVLRRRK